MQSKALPVLGTAMGGVCLAIVIWQTGVLLSLGDALSVPHPGNPEISVHYLYNSGALLVLAAVLFAACCACLALRRSAGGREAVLLLLTLGACGGGLWLACRQLYNFGVLSDQFAQVQGGDVGWLLLALLPVLGILSLVELGLAASRRAAARHG